MVSMITDLCRFYAECIYTDNLCIRANIPAHRMVEWKRRYRLEMKRSQGEDRLAKSFREGRKLIRYNDECGESWTEFRFLRGNWSDDELHRIEDEETVEIRSPYDCTGRSFTTGMDFVRVSGGVIWKHRKALDV